MSGVGAAAVRKSSPVKSSQLAAGVFRLDGHVVTSAALDRVLAMWRKQMTAKQVRAFEAAAASRTMAEAARRMGAHGPRGSETVRFLILRFFRANPQAWPRVWPAQPAEVSPPPQAEDVALPRGAWQETSDGCWVREAGPVRLEVRRSEGEAGSFYRFAGSVKSPHDATIVCVLSPTAADSLEEAMLRVETRARRVWTLLLAAGRLEQPGDFFSRKSCSTASDAGCTVIGSSRGAPRRG